MPTIDLVSVVERIKAEIHRGRAVDEEAIKREIISAIRHYRGRKFFFNEGLAQMNTTDGQQNYGVESSSGAEDGYPADLVGIDLLRITINNSIYPMSKRPIGVIRELNSSPTLEGFPGHWAFYNEQIWLYPIPSQDNWVIDVDYVKDIGTPYYNYTGGEWKFFDESGASLDDSWQSAWFDHAEELIRFRSKWSIYANVILDKEKAVDFKQLEQVALNSLLVDTDNLIGMADTEAVPWY